MKSYVVLRRCAWRSTDDPAGSHEAGGIRSAVGAGRHRLDPQSPPYRAGRLDRHRLRVPSDEPGGGPRPRRACGGLPIDEIVAVLKTLVVEPDPVEAAT